MIRHLVLLLLMAFILVPISTVSADTLSVRVIDDLDDAEDQNNSSNDLDIGQNFSGVRFQNITIPPTATITNAYIEFNSRRDRSGGTDTRIYGEDDIDPDNFRNIGGNSIRNPSRRSRTTAFVDWSPPAWSQDEVGPDTRTPDLSAIVQEIIALPGWASGNNMVFVLRDDGGRREARTHDDDPNRAPLLFIEYTTSVVPPPAVCVVNARDDFDVQSFSNNDGYFNWAGSWTEYDNNSAGPAAGKVRIAGSQLIIDNYTGGEWSGNPGVSREVDLSRYSSAMLNFDYELLGGVDAADWFRVRISSDGGNTWDQTWDIHGVGNGPYSFSEDITPYMSANTVVSIRIADERDADVRQEYGNGNACCYGAASERIEIEFVEILTDEVCGPVAEWRFDELSWNGTSGEVLDETGNGLNATAVGGVNTSFADPPGPALAGDPGTCRFGEFDGNNDYVELPASFPDLQDSFTISAWINPDRISGDQRILVDDESNSGGFAFSLGDGGNGRLRFFSRNVSPVVVDTQSAVISAGQWFHVAAVHNLSDKTRQIYVNGVAVTLDNNDVISTYTGTWGADPGLASIGGETNNAGSEAVPRWRFDGQIDEVRVYDFALSETELQTVMNETHPCAFGPTLGWIEITAGSAASTCAPHPVTITAYDSDPAFNPGAQIFTNYTGTVILNTQTGHGNWSINSASGALNPNPHTTDNGQAIYTFVSADQGSVVLNLSNVHADDLTISATDVAEGVTVLSPLISFRDNAFVITPLTCTDSSCPGTGSTELVAGRDHLFNAALWRRDPTSGDCAIATDYDTASNASYGDLKAWINRDAVDPAGLAPDIGGTVLGNATPALNNLDLSFTSGEAQFTLRTSDVGKYDVYLRDDTSGFALDDQGNDNPADDVPRPIDGSSNTLTVRPFAMGYTNINKNGTPNPSGTATSGAGFVAAGDTFSATIGAYLWQGADDTNNDGLVDDPTTDDVTDNGLTPAYNFLTTLGVDNTGGFTPAAGVAGALGGTTTPAGFTAGTQIIADLTYSEVGSMRLLANTTAFLGTTGVDVAGQTLDVSPVGRFYPHHFDISGVTITEACASGGFTYMDQDELQLQYTLVAQNLGNTTTSNYFTAGYTTGTVTAVAEDNNDGNDLSSRLSNTGSVDWVGGQYAINVTNAQFDRDTTPDGPFDNLQLGVFVTDQDGAEIQNRDMKPDDTTACTAMTCTARSLGTTRVRYGRMAMTNAFGSELLPLTVNTFMQYYDGTFFVTNTLDSCTTLAITDVDLSNYEQASERDGNITINGATVTATVKNSPANNGALNIDLTAPGAGNTGSVDIQPDLSTATGADMPWLLFDWDGDAGTVDEAPLGRATFGIFGGNPQQIYMQELY